MNVSVPANRRLIILIIVLVVVNLALAANAIWEFVPFPQIARQPVITEVVRAVDSTPTSPGSPGIDDQPATPEPMLALPLPDRESPIEGVILLSLTDGNYKHLFAYHPQNLPLTRILGSPAWDDIQPMVLADDERVVFASNQNGYWDLYQLDLGNGTQTRLTDTLVYDGEPEWSPDGQWVVYETYQDDDLEIFIKQTSDPDQQPIRLTEDSSLDTSPTWSPEGRKVAFVSDRTADQEIWLADLDDTTNRYQNISRMSGSQEGHPAWSPNGRYLAFDSSSSGSSVILIWDLERPEAPPRQIGLGSNPVWSPDGSMILVQLQQPNGNGLAIYYLDGTLMLPYTKLPSSVHGMSWLAEDYAGLIDNLPGRSIAPMPSLWSPALNLSPLPAGGRFGIVPLTDVEAPYAFLHDEIDESFIALRQQVGFECGWDFLASLENAYVPITEPPEPGMNPNWLYTGRAIAFNALTLQADWMVIIREDFEGNTYWRVFLKARHQDGSQGMPLKTQPWDIRSRYAGIATAYEQGGQPGPVPGGYWVDVTEIALRYGWQRVPSLTNWRTYYPAMLFNQYVLNSGLDWFRALEEIYPPEALVTATLRPTRTVTPSQPPTQDEFRTATPKPTKTLTPTNRPTFTAAP